eukprot:2805485-Prymnesium_polylepis.1
MRRRLSRAREAAQRLSWARCRMPPPAPGFSRLSPLRWSSICGILGVIFDVYVGRIFSGSPPSDGVWGNPYKMVDSSQAERDRVVASHRR